MSKEENIITALLKEATQGDRDASELLWSHVYDELHKLASFNMRRMRPTETLRPTAIVNEVYLKLFDTYKIDYRDRIHFYALAGRAMRQLLIDHVRRNGAQKRGGNDIRVQFDEEFASSKSKTQEIDLFALTTALEKLKLEDDELANLVELKFFGGLSVDEMADFLGISTAKVRRKWLAAKLWLFDELTQEKIAASR